MGLLFGQTVGQTIKKNGTMDRMKGSGRPSSVVTEENEEMVEELICSQEEQPHSHLAPRKIQETTGIDRSAVRRIVKKKGLNNFKRSKTTAMNEGTRTRRVERATKLIAKFSKNPRMIERVIWQDEKDFPLDLPVNPQNDRVYHKGKKVDVPDENLNKGTKRLTKKVMVSAALSWYGATEPFFVTDKGLKVNAENYRKHLKSQLFPSIMKTVGRQDWIFMQDGASSHTSNVVQNFLKDTLNKRFITKTGWPPASPDVNPLDYYFWDAVKTKVYEDRRGKPFSNQEELKNKIRAVWNDCAKNTFIIRKAIKQFIPRLRSVEEKQGFSIKMRFA